MKFIKENILPIAFVVFAFLCIWGVSRLKDRQFARTLEKKELAYQETLSSAESNVDSAEVEVAKAWAAVTATKEQQFRDRQESAAMLAELRAKNDRQQAQIFELSHGEIEGDTLICLDAGQVRVINESLAVCDSTERELAGEQQMTQGLLITVFQQQENIDALELVSEVHQDRVEELFDDLEKSEKKRKRAKRWGNVKTAVVGVAVFVATMFVTK